MFIAKTPLRISFIGGGTDIPCFYQRYPGAVVSMTIQLYTYVVVHRAYGPNHTIKYSQTEIVPIGEPIKHPIIHHCFKKWGILEPLDVGLFSDVPGHGTGLGSSSSFTVGLLAALHALHGSKPTPEQLAAEACYVELDLIGDPIGKQDQYASAYGGLNHLVFSTDGSVKRELVPLPEITKRQLQERLFLVNTGIDRKAADILRDQNTAVSSDDAKFQALRRDAEAACGLGSVLKEAKFPYNLHLLFKEAIAQSWLTKRNLTDASTCSEMHQLIDRAAKSGATAWKSNGAGGGGFMVFWVPKEKRDQFTRQLSSTYKMLPVHYEPNGCSVTTL